MPHIPVEIDKFYQNHWFLVCSSVPASTCYGPIYSTAHTVARLAIQKDTVKNISFLKTQKNSLCN
jgi:hypothetical protein